MHASALRPLLLARAHAVYSPVQLVCFEDVVLDTASTLDGTIWGRFMAIGPSLGYKLAKCKRMRGGVE